MLRRFVIHIIERVIEPGVWRQHHWQRLIGCTIDELLQASHVVSDNVIDKYYSSNVRMHPRDDHDQTFMTDLDLPPSLAVAALDNNGTNIPMDPLSHFNNYFHYMLSIKVASNLVESQGLLHINNHALWCMLAFFSAI